LDWSRRSSEIMLLPDPEESDGHGSRRRWMGRIIFVSKPFRVVADRCRFLGDHFTESASQLSSSLGHSISRLSLTSQDEETSTKPNPVTPVRSRVASNASTLAGSPNRSELSPRQAGETDTSPLTPLRVLKRASDSPDMRKKEKASLRIGRRSILGKE
jgi:hypothetical protein